MLHRVQAKRIDGAPAAGAVLRRRLVLPADDRRPAGARRAARHRARRRRSRDGASSATACSARSCRRRTKPGACTICADFIARAKAAGVLVAVGTDLLSLTLLDAAGRDGRRRRRSATRSASACRSGYGGPHAAFFATREKHVRQAPGRIIGVSVDAHGNTRVPHGAADARAAHPPREGDVEHLHGAGAAGEHRRPLRRVSRPEGPDGDRRARARATRGCSSASSTTLGVRQLNDALLRHAALRGAGRRAGRRADPQGGAGRRASTSATGMDGTINVALDETVDEADIVALLGGVRGRRARSRRSRSTGRPNGLAAELSRRPRADDAVPHASGVQHASLRNADDAVHPQPRAQGHRPRHVDDSARLLHDEAERGVRDAADHVAGVRAGCIRSRRSSRRRAISRSSASSSGALRDHRASRPSRCSRTPARRASSPG